MVDTSVTSDDERKRGTREIARSVYLVALLAMSAGLFEVARLIHTDKFTLSQILTTLALVSVLCAYVFASWKGWIAKSASTVASVFFCVNICLNLYFFNALFLSDWPQVVIANMNWMTALMIVPFLTINRPQARFLAAVLCLSTLAQFAAYFIIHDIGPFDPFFGSEVIPFFISLGAAYVLLDGFAMFREAAIKFHARSDALQETANLMAKAAADAERAKTEAEKSIALRETFLATMSHELRTPLNAIIGFSDAMKSGVLEKRGVDHYRAYAEDIHQSGEHVLSLINQLLEYSRVRSGTYDLTTSTVSLQDVTEQVIRMSGHAADKRGVRLLRDWQVQQATMVVGDRHALVQIGLNLVMNAIKFSPAGEAVTVRIQGGRNGEAVLSVIDKGPGIPPDRMDDVKQPFVRAGDASLASETGTGLGLAIVSNLTEKMGARFDLVSTKGEGTCAAIILPRDAARRGDAGTEDSAPEDRPEDRPEDSCRSAAS